MDNLSSARLLSKIGEKPFYQPQQEAIPCSPVSYMILRNYATVSAHRLLGRSSVSDRVPSATFELGELNFINTIRSPQFQQIVPLEPARQHPETKVDQPSCHTGDVQYLV